ncbi:MAG TPA: DNA-3-methyladenine glycosylase [Anaerolineae bacterium]|nr:DNA-3-methyladenine glycosylase [Anaerolineae bacterium]
MQITVRLGEPIRRLAGSIFVLLDFDADQVSLADVLARLAASYPGFEAALRGDDLGRTSPYQIFVNARRAPSGSEAQTLLAPGDKVYIFLPAVGGSDAQPLPRSFYDRPTLEVARDLLGCTLVRTLDGQRLAGRICEVEAYVGEADLASHAARGPTPRNRSMYGPGGLAYVYLIYGMHHCLNVVTEEAGFPAAVLIRVIEPLEGLPLIQANRAGRPLRSLTDGPAKLCQALDIDRRLDGHNLTTGIELWLEAGEPMPDTAVQTTPRVNVGGDERSKIMPWRFVLS